MRAIIVRKGELNFLYFYLNMDFKSIEFYSLKILLDGMFN